MGITCAHCKGKHRSVAVVKLCFETRDCIWQIPAAPGHMYCSWCECIHTMDEADACLTNLELQQQAELEAERRAERYFEERGAHEADHDRYAAVYRW